MIKQVSPTKIHLDLTENQIELVKKELTYINKSNEQKVKRFKKNRWFASKYGQEAFNEAIDQLEEETEICLLNDDLTVYSGLGQRLSKLLNQPIVNEVVYPDSQLLPWHNKPLYELYYYQKDSLAKLLEKKHAGVSIATGLGKSYIILHLVKHLGLPTIVMAPSSSIGEQLYESFVYHFGTKYVGKCFDGKKDYKKLITIALPQTLTKLDINSKEYQKLKEVQVFIADESHLCPAKTLADVCFGLTENAPYRFFFSGTQFRNDGQDLLLEAITGPIVYNMTVKEGVDQGFLSKPIFKIFEVVSDVHTHKEDPNDLTRHYLYYNPNVIQKAANLANNFVKYLNHPVLILIDEVEQFTKLLPYLEYEAGFAHGPLSDNKKKVPEKYWDSNPNELVKKFNEGGLQILIGTSCISTGTDIKSVKSIIYLMGGKSGIQIRQAIGRGTRKVEGKTFCNIIDFDVINNPIVHKHAQVRKNIYEDIYGPVEVVKG
jgi:superfamily II DNA or RNA helicase